MASISVHFENLACNILSPSMSQSETAMQSSCEWNGLTLRGLPQGIFAISSHHIPDSGVIGGAVISCNNDQVMTSVYMTILLCANT